MSRPFRANTRLPHNFFPPNPTTKGPEIATELGFSTKELLFRAKKNYQIPQNVKQILFVSFVTFKMSAPPYFARTC